jgi:hypothetical protein
MIQHTGIFFQFLYYCAALGSPVHRHDHDPSDDQWIAKELAQFLRHLLDRAGQDQQANARQRCKPTAKIVRPSIAREAMSSTPERIRKAEA